LVEDVTTAVVCAFATLWPSAFPLLALKSASPLYVAAIVCDPTAKPAGETVAFPPTRESGLPAVPSIVKATVPVGVTPGDAGFTVAVYVTGWPNRSVPAKDVVTTVEVDALPTFWVQPPDALIRWFASALYTAATMCVPGDSADVVNVAVPDPPPGVTPAVLTAVPSTLNVTVPPTLPAPATRAVKVTDWPKDDGFADANNVVVVGALSIVRTPVPVPVGVLTVKIVAPAGVEGWIVRNTVTGLGEHAGVFAVLHEIAPEGENMAPTPAGKPTTDSGNDVPPLPVVVNVTVWSGVGNPVSNP
jgi:hypothetical protein